MSKLGVFVYSTISFPLSYFMYRGAIYPNDPTRYPDGGYTINVMFFNYSMILLLIPFMHLIFKHFKLLAPKTLSNGLYVQFTTQSIKLSIIDAGYYFIKNILFSIMLAVFPTAWFHYRLLGSFDQFETTWFITTLYILFFAPIFFLLRNGQLDVEIHFDTIIYYKYAPRSIRPYKTLDVKIPNTADILIGYRQHGIMQQLQYPPKGEIKKFILYYAIKPEIADPMYLNSQERSSNLLIFTIAVGKNYNELKELQEKIRYWQPITFDSQHRN